MLGRPLRERGGFNLSVKRKRFGGFELEHPTSKVVEPRVFGPQGDELVALVKEKLTETVRAME